MSQIRAVEYQFVGLLHSLRIYNQSYLFALTTLHVAHWTSGDCDPVNQRYHLSPESCRDAEECHQILQILQLKEQANRPKGVEIRSTVIRPAPSGIKVP